jgi:hypothetical protein
MKSLIALAIIGCVIVGTAGFGIFEPAARCARRFDGRGFSRALYHPAVVLFGTDAVLSQVTARTANPARGRAIQSG